MAGRTAPGSHHLVRAAGSPDAAAAPPGRRPDGLQGSEGTFSLCTFLYVHALARAGRLERARYAFDKVLTYANR
ncbi:hypothetical protein PV721_01300 [Streptomyces sp. MB09-01]|uniref:hypothetical protein n=1 Tax=Streptomyces sp. MB09-01 TaxID=3028666 RepID=UPI0029A486D0|nr:hypothetical protein [Streptomyces sp. MB09-01]MDX3533027.1 hypothetical protein [Streptomyces sp. MB09-01]